MGRKAYAAFLKVIRMMLKLPYLPNPLSPLHGERGSNTTSREGGMKREKIANPILKSAAR